MDQQSCSHDKDQPLMKGAEDLVEMKSASDLVDDDSNIEEKDSSINKENKAASASDKNTRWPAVQQQQLTHGTSPVQSGACSDLSSPNGDIGKTFSGDVSDKNADNSHTICVKDEEGGIHSARHSKEQKEAGVEVNAPQGHTLKASGQPDLPCPKPGQMDKRELAPNERLQKGVSDQKLTPKRVRFSDDTFHKHRLSEFLWVVNQEQSSSPEGLKTILEEDCSLSDCESAITEEDRLVSGDSAKFVLPVTAIEDCDAKIEDTGTAPDDTLLSQTENRPETKSKDQHQCISREIPAQNHNTSLNETSKGTKSSKYSQAQKTKTVREGSPRHEAAERTPEELVHPKTNHSLIYLKNKTDDTQNTKTVPISLETGIKTPSQSPVSPEIPKQRQGAIQTCYLKSPPFAPGEKYVCEQCGEFFSLSEHLQMHQTRHPIVRPYRSLRCGGCGASFTQIEGLYAHRDINRKRRGTRCFRCRQWFATCDDLFRHRQCRLESVDIVLKDNVFLVCPPPKQYLRRI